MPDDDAPSSMANPFVQVPVEVAVCVGRAKPKVRELLRLGPGGVLSLDRTVEDPVELYVGDRLIARGELVEAEEGPEGRLAVRLTEIVPLDDRT